MSKKPENTLFCSCQHSRTGSVKCPELGPNKLFISGRSPFDLAEYFLLLKQNCCFAWHTEVVSALALCNLEVSGAVLTWEKVIRKAPSPTARGRQMTHLAGPWCMGVREREVHGPAGCVRGGVQGGYTRSVRKERLRQSEICPESDTFLRNLTLLLEVSLLLLVSSTFWAGLSKRDVRAGLSKRDVWAGLRD